MGKDGRSGPALIAAPGAEVGRHILASMLSRNARPSPARLGLSGALLAALALAGCATVAQVDLDDPACAATFRAQLASILEQEGEKREDAEGIAHRASIDVAFGEVGMRPFVVGSRTTDYTFFVERKKSGCLLRLLSRQKGFTRYTNDITYIATRPLTGCRCTTE